MKAVGVVRRIDDLGRLVIPKEVRRALGFNEGDPMEIFVDGERVIIRRYERGCVFCGEATDDMQTLAGKLVCGSCVNELTKAGGQN
ncbi:AbrB/MazE/SpoVT family DNA-binding domain-containing protein [Alicyclobacillus macrosporangiidus]|jgi:transcriptional pleiotropic regulator of transition state genes|uniref:Transcriptional pleiotropic regulator of transition state genes n=1 Tax=Alicyclobacillus macrosporangiidus TaxID=392015 RepID=A0A1I7FTR8_9BACL|nr:AbrB/MazE/SpoVT family DNA-binding domain-containing protein [Alicyclobacillus macrosporangiidus]SFU39609.1 transcriptional pleiotropic regulator of transition state genes [Alicyclobacillus macrosporangiidus]